MGHGVQRPDECPGEVAVGQEAAQKGILREEGGGLLKGLAVGIEEGSGGRERLRGGERFPWQGRRRGILSLQGLGRAEIRGGGSLFPALQGGLRRRLGLPPFLLERPVVQSA